MSRFDVVVIGGGCTGASVAYHLSKTGTAKVALFEKRSLAAGQTGNSSAIANLHMIWGFGQPPETDMTKLSERGYRFFENFEKEMGAGCGFRKTGMMMIGSKETEHHIREMIRINHDRGYDDRLISTEEARQFFPTLNDSNIAAIDYTPEAGYSDPSLATNIFVDRAKDFGCEVHQWEEVLKIGVKDNHVESIHTSKGEVSCSSLVICTGSWVNRLLQPLGMGVPVKALSADHCILKRPRDFTGNHPVIMDFSAGVYIRPDADDMTEVGYNGPKTGRVVDPDNLSPTVDSETVVDLATRLSRTVEAFSRAEIRNSYCCAYDTTPDDSPIFGPLGAIQGIYLAVGNSGHGYKYCGPVGESISELVLKGKGRDLGTLGLDRFTRAN